MREATLVATLIPTTLVANTCQPLLIFGDEIVIIDLSFPSPTMRVIKVKYALWAADWQRCLHFYRELFGGEITMESEVWSEIVISGATIGIHGGGEGKRTWTGLTFQLDDLRAGIVRLKECGGALTREPNDTPEDPLHLAMCIDPDGNEFMMTQRRQ